MRRFFLMRIVIALATLAGVLSARPAGAQDATQFESDLVATRRVFSAAGAGFRSIRSGPNGNYYVRTAPSDAVRIYDRNGQPKGEVPAAGAAAAKNAALVFGDSFDVDRDGRVVVFDRGVNLVKLYDASGALSAT